MVEPLRVPWPHLEAFMHSMLRSAGLSDEHAHITAGALVNADRRGIDGHGIRLFPIYYRRIVAGGINAKPEIRVVHESPAAAVIDADSGPGQVACVIGIRKAIELARVSGVGWVQVRHSNHPSALGYYPLQAAEQNLLGLAFSNASVSISPWGGRKRTLGNNPMAIAAPVEGRRPLVYDIACSVAAQSQVRMAQEEGVQLPEGLAIDENGNPTRDPAAANRGSILPFGAHKGYGLALMIELLAGVLTGNNHTTQVPLLPNQSTFSDSAGVGHTLVAVDPGYFGSATLFKQQTAEVVREMKATPLRPGFDEVFVPGERSWRCMDERDEQGIPIPPGLLKTVRALGESAGVPFPA